MPTIRWRPSAGSPDDGPDGEIPGPETFDPFAAAPPPPEAVIDAEELLRPLFEPDGGGLLRWRRQASNAPILQIENRYITGRLDLRAADLRVLFRFDNCRFQYPPDVREANLLGLAFRRCRLPGLKARNVRSRNDVRLIRCEVEVNGIAPGSDLGAERGVPDAAVNFTDAVIEGSMILTGTTIRHSTGKALQADRLVVTGAFLAYRLVTEGEVRIPGLRAGGNVNFSGASLRNPRGFALNGNGVSVSGSLLCEVDNFGHSGSQRPFTADGLVFMPSMRVAGDLVFRSARLRVDPAGEIVVDAWKTGDWYVDPHPAFIADRMHVDGNVELSDGLTATGTLRMVNTYIGGSLRLAGATVTVGNSEPPYRDRAIHLDGSQIHGDLEGGRLRTEGQFRLADVIVRGSVRFHGGTLTHAGSDAFSARRTRVSGSLMLAGCVFKGTVRLQGVTVGGSINLSNLDVSEPERDEDAGDWAVDLRSVQAARDVLMHSRGDGGGFRADGGVTLDGAVVKRRIALDGAVLTAPGGHFALDAGDCVAEEFEFTPFSAPQGRISLRGAQCGTLHDNEQLWYASEGVELEDFRYGALDTPIALKNDVAVEQRLTWLRHAARGYRPGPYDQLATMLRASGNEEHADSVLMRKQQYRYEALASGYRWVFGVGVRVWSWLQRWMMGYGYRPVRALAWLLGMLVLGSLWFGLGSDDCVADAGRFVVIGERCAVNMDDTGLEWNPVLYTVDLLVPIADFGNKNRWHMSGADKWVSTGFTAMGWILATTVAAGVTRTLRRNNGS
ncbi:oxidoreductase [Saccharomonospora piscinae]|uniref:Oxidoreductase n=1 Tax=Saccharomonospora piscinae TaxID=687388 RepID=A0A1V9A0D5_SACPI|nr:oxidoreductase [Saccharomonospora piscinae]OQO90615.1 oxidoreductase [Saccharomonospora piscinae]